MRVGPAGPKGERKGREAAEPDWRRARRHGAGEAAHGHGRGHEQRPLLQGEENFDKIKISPFPPPPPPSLTHWCRKGTFVPLYNL